MNIDERIQMLMENMKRLSSKHPEFSCGKFPPEWDKPLTEKEVTEYEKRNNIKLPEDYRKFITTVASGGTQPFYGLYSLKKQKGIAVNEKFHYTIKKPLDILSLSDEEYDAVFETDDNTLEAGYLYLCHEGCGMYSILVVNTDDKDTYGTVWYYDIANDAGIFPIINPINNNTMSFLDWLEYYVDKTLELDDTDFFSYGELVKIE